MTSLPSSSPLKKTQVRIGLFGTLVGFVVFFLGADPGAFGLDRSPVIGFVQIAVFLVGLAMICISGYLSLSCLWNGGPKSIVSDIGLRLVATGYVIAVVCGMADVFGLGWQKAPLTPSFGVWQTIGVLIGEAVIALGFILFTPYRSPADRG